MSPPTKENPARRNVRVGPTTLPREGYQGRTPRWPLPPDAWAEAELQTLCAEQAALEALLDDCDDGQAAKTLRTKLGHNVKRRAILETLIRNAEQVERDVWRQIWRTPMAAMWEPMGWVREVALFVRLKAKAELGNLKAAGEARMLGDRLGMTPLALNNLRWKIAADEVTVKRQETPSGDVRNRIKAVG